MSTYVSNDAKYDLLVGILAEMVSSYITNNTIRDEKSDNKEGKNK